MKKIIGVLIAIILLGIGGLTYYKFFSNNEDNTKMVLNDIAKAFEESSFVKTVKDAGAKISTTVNGNTITVIENVNDEEYKAVYKLDNNILSIDLNADDTDFAKAMFTLYLIDGYGTLTGYKPGELISTLSSEDLNYTLENEGVEITEKYIKFDITKKIPLKDFSNVYFEKKNIDEHVNINDEYTSSYKSMGNLVYSVSKLSDIEILIGEKEHLTELAYKSLQSILIVMFDNEDITEYFNSNCKDLSKNLEFEGFKVEIDPDDETLNEEYKYAKVTINREIVGNKFNIDISEK